MRGLLRFGIVVAVLSLNLFSSSVFAATGKMHCYQSAEHTNCAGSAKAAGESWLIQQSGGRPVYPDFVVSWSTAGPPAQEQCDWAGWSNAGGGGHLLSPPGPIAGGGFYRKVVVGACSPSNPSDGGGSNTANAGYTTPVQECPAGWDVGADGFCFEPPPEDVCAAKAGQPGPTLRGNFDGFETDSYVDADGCSIEAVGSVSCVIPYTEENAARDYFPPVCSIPSQYTGEYAADEPPTQLDQPAPTTAETDSRETTETSVTDPVEYTNNPDGSTTATQRTTRTTVADAGATVDNTPTRSVVVEQEDGRTIVVVTETSTTTLPDGRVVTTTTVDKTVTSHPKTTTTVYPGPQPTVVRETEPEQSETGRTRTTTTTYPDGSTESETTTTGGNGQGADGVSDEGPSDSGAASGPAFDGPSTGDGILSDDPFGTGDRTVGDAFTDFQDRVMSSELITAATGFFEVSGGGSCPVWTVPAVWVFPAITIDMQCNISAVWAIIYAVVVATAGFVAFRWAFL